MGTKTVIWIGNFFTRNLGGSNASIVICNKLSEKGWENIQVPKLKKRFARFFEILFSIFLHRNRYKIAVIEVYSGFAFMWAEMAVYLLKFIRKNIVIVLHGGKLPRFAEKNRNRMNQLLQTATIVVTPSKYLFHYFDKFREDIRYLPNGIEISNYQFKERKKVTKRIVWLRAYHEIYNPLLAIKVIKSLKKVYPDIKLTMIGPDKEDGSMQRVILEISNCNLQENVEIVGPISKDSVPKWLNESDIFINTTNFESFGVSVLEAAACGLPIITTDVGELSYLWKDEQNALLVKPDSPIEMAAAIERLFTELDLPLKMSRNARKNAENYDIQELFPQWAQLLEELV